MNSKLISKETKNDIINFQNIIRYKNKEYKLDVKQFLNYYFVVVPSSTDVSETKYEFKFSIDGV